MTKTTDQDIMDMLKHGHIKPVTLMNDLEDLIPGITRNFTYHYNDKIQQALYDKTYSKEKLHFSLGEPDGLIYKHEVSSKLSGRKSTRLGYQFYFLITDFQSTSNTVTMFASPSCNISQLQHESSQSIELASKQHFFDSVCYWQDYIDITINNIITHVYDTTQYPNIGSKTKKYYDPPNSDSDIHEYMISIEMLWKQDVEQFVLLLDKSRDTLKSFSR